MAKRKNILINPQDYDYSQFDASSADLFKRTIDWMEKKGSDQITSDTFKKVWGYDFNEFQGENKIYSKLLTLSAYSDDPDTRFDLYRICPFSELMAFYSAAYQYTYQVTLLGVCPVWMSDNEFQKHELSKILEDGNVSAFGMSEKKVGADLYSNSANIVPTGEGTYVANGNKYYIGNAGHAKRIATLGKNKATDEWVFWVVDRENRHYNYVKEIETRSGGLCELGEYEMIEYPITDAEILKVGKGAFSDGLSTVNIGKFTCGWAEPGIIAHALMECVTHANRRILYGAPVTETFPHIRSFLTESFCRGNALKLYALRARDYFRMMSPDDRRYLVFNAIIKNKVTREADKITRILSDVICAKAYEADTYMCEAMLSAGSYSRLEGTAHVNLFIIMKCLFNYFYSDKKYDEFGVVSEPKDDTNIFKQSMGKMGDIEFPDYAKSYEGWELENVKRFKKQIDIFREILIEATPDPDIIKTKHGMDYMMNWGELFCSAVYGQLILESAKLNDMEDELIDRIFGYFIRDNAGYALAQINNHDNTDQQNDFFWEIVKTTPTIDKDGDYKFWQEYVQVLDGVYMPKGGQVGLDHLDD